MRKKNFILLILLIVILPRLAGITVTSVFGFNPFAGGQVIWHERSAEQIANSYFLLDLNLYTSASDRWGLLLAPFWLLPGPSSLYAQLTIALLGTIAIFNVFLICNYYHSKQAGILALLPLSLFPSYFFMHSVVQREALVLFALTTAFGLVFLPNKYIQSPYNYILAAGFIIITAYLRFPNGPVVLIIIVVTITIEIIRSNRISVYNKLQIITGFTIAGAISTIFVIQTLITNTPIIYITELRDRRIRGRATYLEEVIPATIPESIGFSWIGAIYFLYTPFPWHVEGINDLLIMLESMVGIGFSIFAIFGVLVIKERSVPATVTLVSGIVLFSVLYGFGTGNYGAGLRHRQTIFWAIYILGAIGLSSKVKFKI